MNDLSRRQILAATAGGVVVSGADPRAAAQAAAPRATQASPAVRIIDFRLRPPFKTVRNFYPPPTNFARRVGMTPPPSTQATEGAMALLLDEMAKAGIVHGVFGGRVNAADPARGSVNEDIITIGSDYPGKFTPFAAIDLGKPMSIATAEVKKCVTELGFKGIALEPSSWNLNVDAAQIYPVYETCQALKAPVMLTLSSLIGRELSYSNPEYLDRVAANFPNLTIISAHANYGWAQQACGLLWKRRNVYMCPDIYGVNFPGHLDYVAAANTYAADRVLFGTAYPLVPMKDIVDLHLKLPYKSDEVIERVLYKNAAELLGISP